MTSTLSEVKEAMELARTSWLHRRETIDGLARFLRVNQSELARRMGLTRQTLHGRLTGTTKIEPWEMAGFAAALGVPIDVLQMSPDDAVRWLLDHPQERAAARSIGEMQSSWIPRTPQRAA